MVSDYDMDASGNWVLIDESSPSPDISGSSGIAFFQSGSVPTGGSVVGLAFTWGSITSDDQGSWTAEEESEGDWSYSGSGSTTLNGTWDVSYGPENAVAGPLVQPGTFYTQQDTTLNADASEGVLAGASIPQGVTVSVSLVSGPSHGSLTLYADGSFDYVPDSGWFGSDSFVVQLDDGTLTSAPMTETIEVSQVISLSNNDFRAVATGDFDDDGNADFVAANYSTAEVYLFLGNGDGTFQTPTAISVGNGAVALAVADLGNGTLDIVVVNSSDGTVTILFNDGNGSFTVSQTLSVGNDPSAVAVGDFLGNGRVDVAVANQGDDTVSLFANDGSGSFTLDSTVNVGTEPAALAAADLNDDALDDLVVANSGDGTISLLLNTGSGGFATPVSYTVGTSPTALVVADFDDDGNLDVAVANSGSDSVSVLLGEGDGSLEDAVSYAVGTTPVDLVVWVGNTAGVPDLLVANQGSDDLTILFNNGFGAFTVSQSIPLGHSPDAVAVADFDNDGLADYVADGQLEIASLHAALRAINGLHAAEDEESTSSGWTGWLISGARAVGRGAVATGRAVGRGAVATGQAVKKAGQAAGNIGYQVVDTALKPVRMGGDLLRAAQFGIEVQLGRNPNEPKWRSPEARDLPRDPSKQMDYFWEKQQENVRDSVIGYTGGKLAAPVVKTVGKGLVRLVKGPPPKVEVPVPATKPLPAAPQPGSNAASTAGRKSLQTVGQTSCFVAGTPLLTPEGAKAIELFRPGDLVLSRSEHDVEAAIEAKPVLDTFVRVSLILELQVGGRSIRTTPEHPFYAVGRGWVPAGHLHAGDLLYSHDGATVRLDEVLETGEVTTVYNLAVADYHTYFVGCQAWGFSVWAHNADYKIVKAEGGGWTLVDSQNNVVPIARGKTFKNPTEVQTLAKKNGIEGAAIEGKTTVKVEVEPPPPKTPQAPRDPFQGHAPETKLQAALQQNPGAQGALLSSPNTHGLDVQALIRENATLQELRSRLTTEQWHMIQKHLTRTGMDLRHGN